MWKARILRRENCGWNPRSLEAGRCIPGVTAWMDCQWYTDGQKPSPQPVPLLQAGQRIHFQLDVLLPTGVNAVVTACLTHNDYSPVYPDARMLGHAFLRPSNEEPPENMEEVQWNRTVLSFLVPQVGSDKYRFAFYVFLERFDECVYAQMAAVFLTRRISIVLTDLVTPEEAANPAELFRDLMRFIDCPYRMLFHIRPGLTREMASVHQALDNGDAQRAINRFVVPHAIRTYDYGPVFNDALEVTWRRQNSQEMRCIPVADVNEPIEFDVTLTVARPMTESLVAVICYDTGHGLLPCAAEVMKSIGNTLVASGTLTFRVPMQQQQVCIQVHRVWMHQFGYTYVHSKILACKEFTAVIRDVPTGPESLNFRQVFAQFMEVTRNNSLGFVFQMPNTVISSTYFHPKIL